MNRLQEELNLEKSKLAKLQSESEAKVKKLKDEVAELQKSISSDSESTQNKLDQLQYQLDAERLKCAELLVTLDKERNEREVTVQNHVEVMKEVSS